MSKNRTDVTIHIVKRDKQATYTMDAKWVGLGDQVVNRVMDRLGEPDKGTVTKAATSIVLQHKDGVHDFIKRNNCPLCVKAEKKAAKKLARKHAEGKHESLHDENCTGCTNRDEQEAEQIKQQIDLAGAPGAGIATLVGENPFERPAS